MKRSALFLDRDGTIIQDPGYLSDPDRIQLLPGVKQALCAIAPEMLLFLVTNQSGIGRGYYGMAEAEACNRRTTELLELPLPGFTGILIAPEAPDQPTVYRKPSPRYISEMLSLHKLDPDRCWMVGDKISDVQAGLRAGIHAVLLAEATPSDLPSGVPVHPDLPSFLSALRSTT